MQNIPTIDIAPLAHPRGDAARTACVAEIMSACTSLGFLSITGTGVDPALPQSTRDMVRRMFAIEEASKWAQAITRNNYRGYIPMGFFTPNDGSGTADKYEGYKLHFEVAAEDPIISDCALYGPNLWPRELPEARAALLTYWREMDGVFAQLIGAIEEGLGLTEGTISSLFETPMTNMSLLHYPPQAADEAGFGIHPHKDTDALTIIAPDPVGGLEVKTTEGDWTTPNCPEGGFVVNIGDMLELWSGGKLVSTPHRVVNKTGAERYSFPYFAVPRHDVVIAPLITPQPDFDRPSVHTGHWSAETWRTNWPDEAATKDTPELGTIHDAPVT